MIMEDNTNTPAPTPTRNEIIRVNGVIIVVVMALIGNLVVVGFGLWLHNIQLFRLEVLHENQDKELNASIHKAKVEIIALEGVDKWEKTGYVSKYGLAASRLSSPRK